jgi:hypothetical protein
MAMLIIDVTPEAARPLFLLGLQCRMNAEAPGKGPDASDFALFYEIRYARVNMNATLLLPDSLFTRQRSDG